MPSRRLSYLGQRSSSHLSSHRCEGQSKPWCAEFVRRPCDPRLTAEVTMLFYGGTPGSDTSLERLIYVSPQRGQKPCSQGASPQVGSAPKKTRMSLEKRKLGMSFLKAPGTSHPCHPLHRSPGSVRGHQEVQVLASWSKALFTETPEEK